jgi:hypothetical protein
VLSERFVSIHANSRCVPLSGLGEIDVCSFFPACGDLCLVIILLFENNSPLNEGWVIVGGPDTKGKVVPRKAGLAKRPIKMKDGFDDPLEDFAENMP